MRRNLRVLSTYPTLDEIENGKRETKKSGKLKTSGKLEGGVFEMGGSEVGERETGNKVFLSQENSKSQENFT